jgi:hypothetical protein
MAEQPALNRFYVASYAANDKDFPILAVRLDPRVAGYRMPEDLSPHPDSKRYPNHVFTGSQPSNGDERVTHIYEILPSPWVPFTRYDDDLGPIQGRRRSVKNEGQQADLAADKKISYEGREGSAIVSNEIEETWSIATDEDGNSLFPLKDRDFYDPSRGAVQERRQLFVPTGEEEGTLENINGVITQTSYEPYNEFLSVKIVQTYKVDGPQLIGRATDNDGQLVTVTTQRKGSLGYIPPSPTATRTVEVNREDAESLVERIVDTPEIFTAKTFSLERPDPIPQKFRVAVPLQSEQEIVAGDAELPTLSEGEISRTEEQRNKFLKRTTATSRDQTVLPKTLIQKSTDNDRQEVTITETLQLGDTNEVATATTTVSSEALGDGNYVVTKTEVPEVFAGEAYRKTKEDLTPQKFRGAQEDFTIEQTIAGTANPNIGLGSGEFAKSEQQVNKFVKRVSTTSRAITTAITLLEKLLTQNGQIATRILTLASGDQSFVPSALMLDASVEALGDGRTVKTETRVPSVFTSKIIRKTKPDLTPEKFRAAQEDTIIEENISGAISQPNQIQLGVGEFSKSEEQVTEFVKRISTTSKIVEGTSSLQEFVLTPQGQVALRTLRLSKEAQSINPDEKFIDASIESLGDGRTIKTETVAPSLFPNLVYSAERPDPAPQKFRVEKPILVTEETVAGEATEPALNESATISETQQQITVFAKRVSKRTRDEVSEINLYGEQTGTWGVEEVEESYTGNANAQTGFGILSSKKIPLGANKYLGEKITVTSPQELIEYKEDPETKILLSIEKKLVPSGTKPPEVLYGASETQAIDAWNSIQIVTRVDELPSAENFQTTINYAYPDILKKAGINWENGKDQGVDVDTVLNTDYILENNLSWNFTTSAFGSSTLRGSAYVQIEKGYSGPVLCNVARSYHEGPPPSDNETIVNWKPAYGTITINGVGKFFRSSFTGNGIADTRIKEGRNSQLRTDTFADTVIFGPVLNGGVSLENPSPPNTLVQVATAPTGILPDGQPYPFSALSIGATGMARLEISATTSPPQKGQQNIILVRVEKWRFGIWIKEVYTAIHP